MRAIKLVLAHCDAQQAGIKAREGQASLSMRTREGELTGINTICKAIARAAKPCLLGETPDEAAQVDQWLAFVHTRFEPIMDSALAELNAWLASRTFVLGHKLSVADLVLYTALSPAVVKFPVAQQSVFCHILRWYAFIHHSIDEPANKGSPIAPAADIPPMQPPSVPSPPAASAKAAAAAAPGKAAAAVSGSSAVPAGAGKDVKKKGDSSKAGAATAAAPAPAQGEGKCAQKAESAGKADKAVKPVAKGGNVAAAPPSVDALDIRVGTITKVDQHPDADGLYLEEIDVGEDKPRQVISGLVKWVPKEGMAGRRVAVVCNLKPAKMRGIVSYGMVLCASTETAVEPVGVPEGVPNGERVMVAGFDGDAEEQLNPKKKVLESLFPDMLTNKDGVPCFKGVPFATSKGPLTSALPDAPVK